VWVTITHWVSNQLSWKLASQMESPYEILQQIGHSFRLKLLEPMKIHLVFHAEKEPPPLVLGDGETEHEVQEVLAAKLVRRKLKYRI
jgi:hypothetical protein